MDWIIHYDDETFIASSGTMTWEDAPAYGILFIEELHKNKGNMIHMGADYYLVRGGTIISCGLQDLHQHIVLGIAPGVMKFGRWCPDSVWDRVHERVFPST